MIAAGGGAVRARIVQGFFLHGAITGTLPTRIPDFQLALGLDESALGLALMGAPIGAFASYAMVARLVETAGTRKVLLWSFVLVTLTAGLMNFAGSGPAMFAVLLVNGALSSASNITINFEADRVEASTDARIMNRCHGIWSIGYFLSSAFNGAIRGAGVDPAIHLWGAAPVFVGATLLLLAPMVECPARPGASASGRSKFALPTLALLALVAFGLTATLLEGSARVWATIYLRDVFGVPAAVQSAALPAMILTMASVRLIGDRWIDRLGPRRVAGMAVATAGLGIAVVVFAGNPYVVILGFAIAGLGAGIPYPLMMSAAARLGDRPAAENMAAVALTMQVVMLVSPMVFGAIANGFGVRAAFACLLPLFALSWMMSRRLS
ncbi:MAG: MFS transporter [Alphaproteobacteria bacterium]|nr:MFS transporter [Alphaproteobacteria bacterium]